MSKELAAQGGAAIETGGQAFPRAGFEGETCYSKPHDGMTLRDYFAAKAMQSLVQALIVSGHYSNEQTNIASIAYEHADAMLAEREKGRQVEAARVRDSLATAPAANVVAEVAAIFAPVPQSR